VQTLRERSGDAVDLVGKSPPMNHLRQLIEKVAPTNSRVMISGPSGSGKELVARAIHRISGRASGPFVVANAAAITPERMEEALFGTEPMNGAGRRIGALEEAHNGTLYLDEIGDMPRETQNKILRVLVEQSFQRVGGSTKVNVDVRIVSSTARDLEREIADGEFREDLFHRLAVVPMRVPALAERREDIPDLVRHFATLISRATGLPERQIGDDAMAVLQAHDWPGNLRQLRNNVERLLILARGDAAETITAEMLPAEIGEMLPTTPGRAGGEHLMSLPLRDAREIFEREYLRAQVNRFGGNISRTAEFVGMERSALHRKLKSLGVG
jgi:two-component system, NtrC family, nitrogen regulation response regulator NtrX